MIIAIGAFLNALGILLGALCGLAAREPLSARTQEFFKAALGTFTVFYGLRLVYENVHGTLFACLKQFCSPPSPSSSAIGSEKCCACKKYPTGLAITPPSCWPPPSKSALQLRRRFCRRHDFVLRRAAGHFGAVADGLENYFYLLLVKAVMDGLAMMSFVKTFRWPVALRPYRFSFSRWPENWCSSARSRGWTHKP